MITFKFLDTDIYRYIASVGEISVKTSQGFGQLTANPLPQLNLVKSNFWNTLSKQSPFYQYDTNLNWEIKSLDDTNKISTYFIKELATPFDSDSWSLTLTTELQKTLDKGCIYSSQGTETPTDAILSICNEYLIPIDMASWGKANGTLALNRVLVSCNFLDPSTTLADAISKIAEIGVLRLYVENNLLCVQEFVANTSPSTPFYLTDNSNYPVLMHTAPNITNIVKDKMEGYNITTLQSVATYGDTQGAKSISAGEGQPIQITTLQGGVWIGEQWMKYMQYPQKQISFSVSSKFAQSLTIGTPIELALAKYDIATKIEVIEITRQAQTTKITGVTL